MGCVYAVGGELTVGSGASPLTFSLPVVGLFLALGPVVPFVPRGPTGTQDQPSQLQNPEPGGQRAQLFKVCFSTERSGVYSGAKVSSYTCGPAHHLSCRSLIAAAHNPVGGLTAMLLLAIWS